MISTSIESDLEGLADLFTAFPEKANRAMSQAMNTVVERKGIKMAAAEMQEQVNYPAGYLGGDRLFVTRKASPGNLVVGIGGRSRASSLARFAKGGRISKSGMTVEVRRGASTVFKRAFLVRLKSGTGSVTDDNYNVGMALRLKPGETVDNRYKQTKLIIKGKDTGLTLLYGPSVYQIFDEVSDKVMPLILDEIEGEFFRNLDRMLAE